MSLAERVRRASVQPAPPPWIRRCVRSVGGLTDVGFGRGSDMLLVVSSRGRGVIDCATGDLVTRDSSVPTSTEDDWQDTFELEAKGFGPLAGQVVRTAGLHGGALARGTRDGWSIECFTVDWPDSSILLTAPGAWIYETRAGHSSDFTKVACEAEVRAWGFSPTGLSLVLATSSEVTVFGRSI
ncbi:MAG: hypothetical protein AAGA56_29655 [Myxococcota bacterium]